MDAEAFYRRMRTPIGHRKDGTPIYLIAGGAPDDSDDDDANDGDDDDNDEDEEDDDGEEWTPPTKEEWEQAQQDIETKAQKLRRANREAADRKRYLRQNNIDPRTGTKLDGDDDDEEDDTEEKPRNRRRRAEGDSSRNKNSNRRRNEDDDDGDEDERYSPAEQKRRVKREAKRLADREIARVEARYENSIPVLVTEFAGALDEMGFSGGKSTLARAMRLIDFNNIEVDPEGEIVGLDDELDAIKADFPEWFKGRKRRAPASTRTRRDADGGSDEDAGRTGRATRTGSRQRRRGGAAETWEDKIARQLVNG